jgi:outer membrane lipoprotein carrier protein
MPLHETIMRKALFPAAAVLVLFASVSPAWAGPLDDLKRLQRDIHTVKASFVQEKHTELYDRPIESRGTFYFKAGAGVRWEYEEMTVIYDGEYLYLYYKELEEAEKVRGVAGYAGPLSFDLDLLLKDYTVESTKKDGGILLVLTPRKKMPFTTMKLFFPTDAAFPRTVTTVEETGDQTVISFSQVETNVSLPGDIFSFSPPPGVDVRERTVQ